MSFVLSKYVYSSLLKTSRLRLRFKNSSSQKLLDVLLEMPRIQKLSPLKRGDTSLRFIGLEIFGNTSSVSPCAINLNVSARNYLFNCGEGLQRVWSEYKIKPSRFRNFFFTYPSWKNIGGFTGAVLSLQESNVKSISIHGHPCLGSLFYLMRGFANFSGITQNTKFYEHNSKFLDEFISAEFIHLHRSPNKVNADQNQAGSAFSKNEKAEFLNIKEDIIHKEGNNFLADEQKNDSLRYKQDYAISYIIHTGKSNGSLNFEKCMNLGVPIGPLLGKLKRGEDVTLSNGNVVKSSEVKNPDSPGVIIIVVECPSEDFLDSLVNEPAFFKHESNREEYYTCAVIHLSSEAIVNNEKYQQWMKGFSKDTKHVFVNEACEISAFVGLHRHHFKLNMLHPEIFPPIHAFGIPEFPRLENTIPDEGHMVAEIPPHPHEKNSPYHMHSDKVFYRCVGNNIIKGEALCEVILKPAKSYDYSKCLTLKKKEYFEELMEIPNFKAEFEKHREQIQNIEKASLSDKKLYPKIVFLGTGSKKPSKTRNSSGILVFFNEEKSVILDCGESTYCQLLLFYGKQRTKEILTCVDAIFISHMHIDHHLGLITLLLERKVAFDELNKLKQGSESTKPFKPLYIIAPGQIVAVLDYMSTIVMDISDLFILIPSAQLSFLRPKGKTRDLLEDLNLHFLQTATVDHTPNSFGVAMRHLDGWKLTYSGDTKPCENLVKIGKNSDVLIHEATFDDVFEKEAQEKLHTTTKQAVLIGRKMNAKFILLTHFSQRYSHIPMIRNELLSEGDVGVAFDFMQVSPYQFPILPYLYEPLKLIFTSYKEKLEHQDAMLKLKRERDMNYLTSEVDLRTAKLSKTGNL